jgi:hypothetical protein
MSPVGELEAERAAMIVSATGKGRAFSLDPPSDGGLTPTDAWSRRVRRVGGLIQVAFAALWLVRGSLVIGGGVSGVLIAVSVVAVIGVSYYAIRVTAGTAPRPKSRDGKRLERDITIATVIELAAAFALPVLVTAAGHSDWVLPSIAITIGPLLLYLDHRVHIPRYRPAGWLLTVGPVILVAAVSGTPLIATTGIASGMLLLGTAAAGFHDLAGVQSRARQAASSNGACPVQGARP